MLEDSGYRRDEIRSMSRWYFQNVIQHRRNQETGELVIPSVSGTVAGKATRIPLAKQVETLLRRRGYPEHLIAGRAQEMADMESRNREKLRGGKRPVRSPAMIAEEAKALAVKAKEVKP